MAAVGRRILMYSQDGFGLGHFRRSSNIAREILAREPESKILILVDSPAPQFAAVPGADYLKLPTVVKTGSTAWEVGTLGISLRDAVEIRAAVILETYRAFRPDIVLVDHMPVGAIGELKPMLESTRRSRARPKLFLGLRDVLDRPEIVRHVWEELGVYDYLELYDGVLVYGCREIYDTDSAYEIGSKIEDICFTNYVSRSPSPGSTDGAEVPDKPYLLMMGGGGHDAFPLARAFLKALPDVVAAAPLQAVLLTGPNMPAAERRELARAASSEVHVARALPEATAWIRHAAAVVCMGGYNSLCEILTWRRKSVVVPRAGPSHEQRIRSRLFAERGLVRMLDSEQLAPEPLASALSEALAADGLPDPPSIPPLDGAARSASALLGEREAVATSDRDHAASMIGELRSLRGRPPA